MQCVINMQCSIQEHTAIKSIIEYLLQRSAPYPDALQALQSAIGPDSNAHVGLILSERLINMPVQIAPHMYRLLDDEMRWAVEQVRCRSSLSVLPANCCNHRVNRFAFRITS